MEDSFSTVIKTYLSVRRNILMKCVSPLMKSIFPPSGMKNLENIYMMKFETVSVLQ